MFILVQLCLLLFVAVILVSVFPTKKVSFLIAILLAMFMSMQIASVSFGGSLIDYKFFVHLGADVWKLRSFFTTQILLILVSFALLVFLILYLSRKWKLLNKINGKANVAIIILCLLLMSIDGGAFRNIYDVAKLNFTPEKDFIHALYDLGINPSDYTLPEEVKATPGKNIIVISLESFEKGFLNDRLASVTPNLRRLAKEMTFFNMSPAPGSDWTAGSIYTEITGLPAFFKNGDLDTKNIHNGHNAIFQSAFDTKITGLGHILDKAGYNLTYILGASEFAGVGDVLRTNKFKVKSDDDFSEEFKYRDWGTPDYDLFNEAKKEILAGKESGAPFALFMSTVSTHAPDGVYDARFEGQVAKQRSNLEFMAAAVDHMIGDLYKLLEKEGMLSNTAIFIFPDHLLMSQTATVLNDFPDSRGLYLITNAPENKLSYATTEDLLQIDIPKIILEGAEVKHNGKFLTDFLQKDDKLEFIKNNKQNILALNEASLKLDSYKSGITVELTDDRKLYLKSGSHIDTISKVVEENDVLFEIVFDQNLKLLSYNSIEHIGNYQQKHNVMKLYVDIKDNTLYASLKKGELLGVAKKGDKKVFFTKDDIDIFQEWNVDSRLLSQNYISPYNNYIYLTSTTGLNIDNSLPKTEVRVGSNEFRVSRGINLLTKDGGQYKVESFDTYGDPVAAESFVKRLRELKGSKSFYAFVVHDSGEAQLKKYANELKTLGYEQLVTLNFSEAYIGYSFKGIISELKDKKTLSFKFPEQMPQSLRSDKQIEKEAKDVERFIAHAGGKINGELYTNSLEALNGSYEKGFRLFELDILVTSDGGYVAAHDWESWAERTKYEGSLPPTYSDFLKYRIEPFTPLDMEGINNWFSNHKDAILVTDKINEPKVFSQLFIDKNRLMMELFTLDAVKEGLSAGIRSAMPSTSVIQRIEGNKAAFLKHLKVKHVAVTRNMVEDNPELLLELKNNNIKVYVFHINPRSGKGEAFAAIHDLDYVYGLYADEWSF